MNQSETNALVTVRWLLVTPMPTTCTRVIAMFALISSLLTWAQPMHAQERELHLKRLQCLACHAGPNRIVTDPETGKTRSVTIKIGSFRKADHGKMECLECHEKGFDQYPHVGMETNVCMDCHPRKDKGAEDDKPYEFKRMQDEFHKTVHFKEYKNKKAKCCGLAPKDHVIIAKVGDKKDNQLFTCEHCHDPHYFMATKKIKQPELILENDNGPCLRCHEPKATGMLADPVKSTLAAAHEYLPHVDLHLKSTRCIDCHTSVTKAVMHDLPEGKKADQGCNTCHSVDTVLTKRLYRYVENVSNNLGFENARSLQDSYVMGAHRNRWTDLAAYVLTGLLILIITVHVAMRFRFKNRTVDETEQLTDENGDQP